MEKYVNRAAKLSDGQKMYIPRIDEQMGSESANQNAIYQSGSSVAGVQNGGFVDINTATLLELDKLPGIGPVYGQSIIDNRPYSNIEELLSKGALKQSVYEKIKDEVGVY